MKWNQNTGMAMLLIVCGALILLSQFGVVSDALFDWIIPLAMVPLGLYGIRNGRSKTGWIVLTIGLLLLADQLWGLLVFLVPIGLIWYGWTLLKRQPKVYE